MSAKEKKSIIKNRLRLALVSNIFISAYATGVVDCLLNPAYKGEFTFSYIIAAFFHQGKLCFFIPLHFLSMEQLHSTFAINRGKNIA